MAQQFPDAHPTTTQKLMAFNTKPIGWTGFGLGLLGIWMPYLLTKVHLDPAVQSGVIATLGALLGTGGLGAAFIGRAPQVPGN